MGILRRDERARRPTRATPSRRRGRDFWTGGTIRHFQPDERHSTNHPRILQVGRAIHCRLRTPTRPTGRQNGKMVRTDVGQARRQPGINSDTSSIDTFPLEPSLYEIRILIFFRIAIFLARFSHTQTARGCPYIPNRIYPYIPDSRRNIPGSTQTATVPRQYWAHIVANFSLFFCTNNALSVTTIIHLAGK